MNWLGQSKKADEFELGVGTDHSVLAAISNPALGRATEIMLHAIGFQTVVIAKPEDVCERSEEINPTFIIFTPDYLTSSIQEKMAIGCPCAKKIECKNALTVIFLRKKTMDNIVMSKQMGFDGIIFADQSMERLRDSLKTVFDTANTQL